MPNSYDLAVTRYIGDYFLLAPVELGDVQVVSPLGEKQGRKYKSTCSGNVTSYNQIQHECRIDTSDKARGYPVITFEYREAHTYGQWQDLKTTSSYLAGSWYDLYHNDSVSYIGDRIVRWDWDPDADTFENGSSPTVLYDLFDYISPETTANVELNSLTVQTMKCNEGDAKFGVDYHHGSSINVGQSDDYLITLRNMDMLMSLARDGSGKNWAISPTLTNESALAFENEEAKFYAPHDVTQVATDRYLLIDEGNNRPNCTATNSSVLGCFSRAVEIHLDWDAGLVRCKWQFAFPNNTMLNATWASAEAKDVLNVDGGSVEILDNGNYLVAFTHLDTIGDDYSGQGGRAYEIDSSGEVVGMMIFPNMPECCDNAGHYRALSASSINGESHAKPFS